MKPDKDKVRMRVVTPIAFEVYEDDGENSRCLFMSRSGAEAYSAYCTLKGLTPEQGDVEATIREAFVRWTYVPVLGIAEDRRN
jgi:hypothetical protein